MNESIHLSAVIPRADTPIVKEKCPYINENRDNLSRYKAMRKWCYYLLERPNTRFSVLYHFTSLLLILGSLIVSVLSTIEEMEAELEHIMFYYELFLLVWFSLEFTVRLWSCSYISRFQGRRGRLRFLFSVYMLIDIFVILSTMTTFVMQINGSYFSILRITRFMQVFRILRIDRQRGDFRTMGNVVKEHSKELITVYFVGFVIMFSATYVVYLLEKHTELLSDVTVTKDEVVNKTSEVTIDNMANGLYWAVITVTSVGYGDFSPITWGGKIICAIFALIGCAFFSLPAGILGSGFALQVAKQKKEKRYVKVRNPAAYLIQTMWRSFTLRKDQGRFEASWYYLLPQLRDENMNAVTPLEMLMRNEIRSSRPSLGSIVTPIFSITGMNQGASLNPNEEIKPASSPRLYRDGLNTSANPLEEGIKKLGKIISRRNSDANSISGSQILNKESLLKPKYRYLKKTKRLDSKKGFKMADSNGTSYNGYVDHEDRIHEKLSERYKIALRFIMKLRYWTAIKIFKSVRHPFVNMQDIMEKNAMSHVEMLGQIKSMKDSFNMLHEELLELRYSLMELKKERDLGYINKEPPNEININIDRKIMSKSTPNSPKLYEKARGGSSMG